MIKLKKNDLLALVFHNAHKNGLLILKVVGFRVLIVNQPYNEFHVNLVAEIVYNSNNLNIPYMSPGKKIAMIDRLFLIPRRNYHPHIFKIKEKNIEYYKNLAEISKIL